MEWIGWLKDNGTQFAANPIAFLSFGAIVAVITAALVRAFYRQHVLVLTESREQAAREVGVLKIRLSEIASPASVATPGSALPLPPEQDLASQAGLTGAFGDRGKAGAAIKSAVEDAEWVWVLSNKGDDWVGDGGILVRPLLERWARGQHVRLRLLLLHPMAPWLRGRSNTKGWMANRETAVRKFVQAHEDVVRFASHDDVEGIKFHKLDPSWRFVMTNREIFIQTYKTIAQVSDERVLRFSTDSPIYLSAYRFYEYVYELASAPQGELSVLEALLQKPVRPRTSAGLVLTRDHGQRREVLLLKKDDLIALPKGGIDDGETPLNAALRELQEETGLETANLELDSLELLHLEGAYQPDCDQVMLKGLVFFHGHAAGHLDLGTLNSAARWYDESSLQGLTPRYQYLPDVLQRVGFRPMWKPRPFE